MRTAADVVCGDFYRHAHGIRPHDVAYRVYCLSGLGAGLGVCVVYNYVNKAKEKKIAKNDLLAGCLFHTL